jgi:hypothetical protein
VQGVGRTSRLHIKHCRKSLRAVNQYQQVLAHLPNPGIAMKNPAVCCSHVAWSRRHPLTLVEIIGEYLVQHAT